MTTHKEFEKEFPILNFARSPAGNYKSRITREVFIFFCMYKMQESEIATLKAELALLRDALEAYQNGS